MAKKSALKKSAKTSTTKLELLDTLLPTPPLIDGEDQAEYESFLDAGLHAVKPKDAIERVWVQDFIDYSWESQRLRRMKVALIQAARRGAVKSLLNEYINKSDHDGAPVYLIAERLSENWARSEKNTVKYVEQVFKDNSLNFDNVMAEAISRKLKDLERIDKLIASYDYRRDAAIRELEKRRESLARRARELANQLITDVEAEEIKSLE